jgi:hypothetical protein
MALKLPDNVYKIVLGFQHPKPSAGFSETYYLFGASLTSAQQITKMDTLVTARTALMLNDSQILFGRITTPVTTTVKRSYKKAYFAPGLLSGGAGINTLPPEVVVSYWWVALTSDEKDKVKTHHYLGCIPNNKLTTSGNDISGVGPTPAGYWADINTFITAIKTDFTQVYKKSKVTPVVLDTAPISTVQYSDLGDRDRGRPFGLWHGIHGM